jgi:hypothetical protein
VPTQGLDAGSARRFSTFLTYVRGPGQVRGSANGQLAAGYLPLSASSLPGLTAYTKAAAAAVRAQDGFVPKPSDPGAAPPAAGPDLTGGGTGATGGGTSAGAPVSGTTGDATGGLLPGGTTTGAPAVPDKPTVAPVLSAGSTPAAALDWRKNALPLLILLAVGCGALGLWTSGALGTMARPRG